MFARLIYYFNRYLLYGQLIIDMLRDSRSLVNPKEPNQVIRGAKLKGRWHNVQNKGDIALAQGLATQFETFYNNLFFLPSYETKRDWKKKQEGRITRPLAKVGGYRSTVKLSRKMRKYEEKLVEMKHRISCSLLVIEVGNNHSEVCRHPS